MYDVELTILSWTDMTSSMHARVTKLLILLGIDWVFALVLGVLTIVWGQLFTWNRVWEGDRGSVELAALSVVPAVIAAIAAGWLVPVFIRSPRLRVYIVVLAVLAALGDLTSFGGVRYRGRPMWQGLAQAAAIFGAVIVGAHWSRRTTSRTV